jgi:heptose I phosphotransferase
MYFAKIHSGVGWREILKNLCCGRAPIVSAENEWRAIERLERLGIPTTPLAARGIRGRTPACFESFVVTEALEGMVSLEDLTREWHKLPAPRRVQLKRQLISQLATVARAMHGAGMNHRDFYLCHFLVPAGGWQQWEPGDPLALHLIDLHRVQERRAVPARWLIKDLGGLLFSALDAGLTRRDLLRFVEHYRERPWREVLKRERKFWLRVWNNAVALYRPFHHREPPLSI